METTVSLSQRRRQLMDQHQMFLDYEDACFTGCYYANML